MKNLILALSLLLSSCALADTNGVYSIRRELAFTHATVQFSPAYKNTNYVVTLKAHGGKTEKAKAVRLGTNSFTAFCSAGTTNLVWSVKHK